MKTIAHSYLLLLMLPLLAGCENNLIFMERSGFNLSIEVNENPVMPVQVNGGMMRSIVAMVPGRGGDNSGEAVSLISGYDLAYQDKDGGFFNDKLVIRSQFVSGAAAREIATSPTTAAKIANAKVTLPLDASVKLRAKSAVNKIDKLPDDKALLLANLLNSEYRVAVKFPTTTGAIARAEVSDYTARINSIGELELIENALGRI